MQSNQEFYESVLYNSTAMILTEMRSFFIKHYADDRNFKAIIQGFELLKDYDYEALQQLFHKDFDKDFLMNAGALNWEELIIFYNTILLMQHDHECSIAEDGGEEWAAA